MSLPTTIKAVAISKASFVSSSRQDLAQWLRLQTGDFNVIEKATLPFPNVNPGDIVVKVCLFQAYSRIISIFLLGGLLWCQFH